MKRALLLLFLCGAGLAQAAENAYLQSVEIVPRDKAAPITPATIPLSPKADSTDVYIEVGDTLDNQLLRLHPKKGVTADFRLEQSFETSVTIMAEGPHLALLDWKHYTSPWQPLKKLNATDFVARKISRADAEKFPEVTADEIRAAVKKFGGAEWTNRLQNLKGPNDYPAGVGISTIRVRILVQDGREWKVIHTLNFLVPMGC